MEDHDVVPRIDEVKRAGLTALVYGLSAPECLELAALVRARFPYVAAEIMRIKDVAGSKRSVHIEGLAVDIVLVSASGDVLGAEAHEEFGRWWEKQHELCRWGGRFGDAGHYSVTPDGFRK